MSTSRKHAVAAAFGCAAILSATCKAPAAEDTYCRGSRYGLGEPFIDSSKVRPDTFGKLSVDPIVRIERVERRDGPQVQTIAYVYYNKSDLASFASAPESVTSEADKAQFVTMLSRIGSAPPPAELAFGTRFGNGLILFFVGSTPEKALDSNVSFAPCVKIVRT